jgi:tRNA A-37 threonylcarbamoyl transferase component Bud32
VSGQIADDLTCDEVLSICREGASPYKIVAATICDPYLQNVEKKPSIGVLLILESPRLVLKHRVKTVGETSVSILAVDMKTFEKDLSKDWLGGLLAENLLTPYKPLVNASYLWEQEVRAKKKIIVEILANLVLEYPTMSHELLIKPEYFMLEAMARKAFLYPPIEYKFLKLLEGDLKEENRQSMMRGFDAALKLAAADGLVSYSDEFVKITPRYIKTVQKRKLRMLNLLKGVRNSILRHSLEVFPKMMRSLLEDYSLYLEHFMNLESYTAIRLPELEDTKRHVFIPTTTGLVSISDRASIKDFARNIIPEGRDAKIEISKVGGVLNAVYALKFRKDGEAQKIIVKVFKNWYGWKWFPLALWALGTRGFSVLGKSRLEREYAINRYLSNHGCGVPEIIHMSPKQGLIFEEYVEGQNFSDIIKQICSSEEKRETLAKVVNRVGQEVAKVHGLDVALGDCKPENFIVANDGEIFFVDLEQAERGGDQAWDVAELLYFSGHYASLSSSEVAQTISGAFIDGYLAAGGSPENVKKARSPWYIKVFSFFASPHILYTISNTCEEKLKGKDREVKIESEG